METTDGISSSCNCPRHVAIEDSASHSDFQASRKNFRNNFGNNGVESAEIRPTMDADGQVRAIRQTDTSGRSPSFPGDAVNAQLSLAGSH
jgi:hypothetical protein